MEGQKEGRENGGIKEEKRKRRRKEGSKGHPSHTVCRDSTVLKVLAVIRRMSIMKVICSYSHAFTFIRISLSEIQTGKALRIVHLFIYQFIIEEIFSSSHHNRIQQSRQALVYVSEYLISFQQIFIFVPFMHPMLLDIEDALLKKRYALKFVLALDV